MSNKEILTLQFGHYSNFVGAHWWNLQELNFQYNPSTPSQINHDVLYREGRTSKGEVTFTPRLLLVDLQGSLGSLPEEGDLYESKSVPSNSHTNWNDNPVEIEQVGSHQSKNKFLQDLDDPTKVETVLNKNYNFETTTKVWSDFLYSRFHPRTIEIVKGFQHGNENTPFDAFTIGRSVWKTSQFDEDFSDRIRNYIEECDHFQGFHFLTDCTNAFAGLSSSCLEYLRDEYDRKSCLVVPVIPSYYCDNDFNTEEEKTQSIINDSVRVLNLALSFNEFGSHSSFFVPLSLGSTGWRQPGPKRIFKNLDYNNKLAYHSSAILAAALDTFTLKHRLKSSAFSLSDLAADLTRSGRKAVAATVNMSFPLRENCDLLECLDSCQESLFQNITPRCNIGNRGVIQHVTIRGIKEEQLKKPLNMALKQRELPAYKCNTVEEMMTLYLAYSTEATVSNVTVVNEPLNIKTPFPQIFRDNINISGFISDQQRSTEQKVGSIPLLAGLHSTSEIGGMLESLHTEARKIKINRFQQFVGGDLNKDDYEECLDNLFTLRENYEDNYLI